MNFLASNGSDLLDLDARAILQGCSLLPGFIALTFTLYYIPGYEWLWMVIMISKSPFAKSLAGSCPGRRVWRLPRPLHLELPRLDRGRFAAAKVALLSVWPWWSTSDGTHKIGKHFATAGSCKQFNPCTSWMWQILLIDLRGWKIQRLTVRLVSICLTFMAQLRRAHAAPHSESAVLAVSRGLQISSSLPKTYKDLQKSYKHCSHQSTEVGVLDSSLAQDPPAVPPSGLEPQQPKGGKCTKQLIRWNLLETRMS